MSERSSKPMLRPKEPITIGEFRQRIFDEDFALEGDPIEYETEGKTLYITSDSVVRAIRLAISRNNHRDYIGRNLSNPRYQFGIVDGFGIDHYGGRLFWHGPVTGKSNGFGFDPSVVEPSAIEQIVQRAIPETEDEYAYYIKDILKYFCNRGKVQSLRTAEMDQWYSNNEDWTYETEELVDRIAETDKFNKELLGDDYSISASIQEIAKKLHAEALASDDPATYAKRFATSWLELRFKLEEALRTQQHYTIPNTYKPGTSLSAKPVR